ncbi:MAG: PEGA domain-containing protein, partial [Patescibacteria group bacterium]
MASAKRKMMFLFFILLFVVMASLVIFYAQGYRLRLSWPLNLNETLQKTGMLVLKTEPKEARIYINNSFQSYLSNKITSRKDKEYTQTPAKIKYLLPGKYKITVKKEGYWTWEKDVVIEPGKQTRLENVRLFKKTLPRRIAEA